MKNEVTIKMSRGTKAIAIAAIVVYGCGSIAKVSGAIGLVNHVCTWTKDFYNGFVKDMKSLI